MSMILRPNQLSEGCSLIVLLMAFIGLTETLNITELEFFCG